MFDPFMQLHGPKRVYTQDSLEFWFGKLEREWDNHFPSDHLEAGRKLYRSGGVREVALSATDAIIHCRFDKKDEYSVIEWADGGRLSVRSSSSDRVLADTMAVAGLHEIEELVADEISALPTEMEPVEPGSNGHGSNGNSTIAGTNGHGNGNGAGTRIERSNSLAERKQKVPLEPESNGDSDRPRAKRELLLKFRVVQGGLVCEPWWESPDGARAPALHAVDKADGKQTPSAKKIEHAGGNNNGHAAPPPSATERMKLISLTALARKSHFQFHGEVAAYILEQIPEIPHFLKNVLPTWKRRFKIEQEATVERLLEGVSVVKVEARARRSTGNEIDLEWIFRSGEQLISAEDVVALNSAGGNPVIISGVGLVSLAPESVQSLDQWQEATADFEPDQIPAYMLFSLFNDQRCQLTLMPELKSWRESILKPRPKAYKLPEFLRPYQKRGVEWMAHLCDNGCHCLLADEMGLGKTLQVISLMAARPLKGVSNLVVCPASVVPVWQEEIARFFPKTKVFVLKNGHSFKHERAKGVWLASYAQLRNHRELLDENEFGYVVLDEGQFIKNPDAKITNTCFAIRARHRIVMTGTPLENRQLDIWSILRFLLPGLLGTRASFENAIQNERDATIVKLRMQLAPFILRRTKAEVATELPPKVEIDTLCPLTDVQRREYARVCHEGLERLGDDIGKAMREKSFGFLSLLTRLRQVCCDPDLLPWMNAHTDSSGKLALLVERLGEIVSSGHKVVIFSQFVMFLKRVHDVLAERFPDVPRFELTGATIDRQKPVQDFQGIDQPAFMLVSLKAAGTGITLHAADYVFLLDPWWNPSVEDQAVDRVHRIGQTRTVFVYRMITRGTIEERLQALKAEKKQLFQQIIEGVSGDIDIGTHFHSLRELIELPPDSPDASEDLDE